MHQRYFPDQNASLNIWFATLYVALYAELLHDDDLVYCGALSLSSKSLSILIIP